MAKIALSELQDWNAEIIAWIRKIEGAKGGLIAESALAQAGILRPAASADALDEAQDRLAVHFPDAVLDFYRLTNGLSLPGSLRTMNILPIEQLQLLRVASPEDGKFLSAKSYLGVLFPHTIPSNWDELVIALSVDDPRQAIVVVSTPETDEWPAATLEWVGGLGVTRFADLGSLLAEKRRQLLASLEARFELMTRLGR